MIQPVQHILCTTETSGLGLQMAQALGELGATVVISARKAPALEAATAKLIGEGLRVSWIAADNGKDSDVARLASEAIARLGHVDLLVNNAGATWGAPAEDYPSEAWRKVMSLNVDALFLVSQEVGRRSMIPRRSGKIVNVASVAGLGGTMGMSTVAYNASKGAVISFTRALAAEWGRYNINVNALCPGFFPSRMKDPDAQLLVLTVNGKLRPFQVLRRWEVSWDRRGGHGSQGRL